MHNNSFNITKMSDKHTDDKKNPTPAVANQQTHVSAAAVPATITTIQPQRPQATNVSTATFSSLAKQAESLVKYLTHIIIT